jgi:putative salt-induced outer membrane protein YdiY
MTCQPSRLFKAACANILCALILLCCTSAFAAKTDVVLLVNGDTITGEVKSLDFGSLRYSTDSMGTVNVDWEDVATIKSNQKLQVEITDGTRYFGSLVESKNRHSIVVVTGDGPVELENSDVTRMTPIETDSRLVERLDGSISLGSSSQKGSGVSTLNLASNLQYRTRTYLIGLDANATVTDQPSEPTSARYNLGGNFQRFRNNRWFTEWLASYERNDELGILSRVQVGYAVGRYLVQTNKNQFSIKGGAVESRETFVGDTAPDTKAEGLFEFRWLHRKLVPEASASFVSTIYPTLDDFSSYRAETDLTFRREFIHDLFFDLSVYHSYLSEPPEGSSSTDYGVTTSLGYSF